MKKIILASNSPRRKQLLAGLDIDFEVRVVDGIDESYPDDLPAQQVAPYLAKAKAENYRLSIAEEELIITADTVVVLHDKVLGKPVSRQEAVDMLSQLSGQTHEVITGVCLTTKRQQHCLQVTSEVTFKTLTQGEIDYYVDRYKPYDKAGAYGIQEWIGYVGVSALKGSYFNVMGLPVQRIYSELVEMGVIRDGKVLP